MGIVEVAGEAGELPDDQASYGKRGFRESLAEVVHHLVELVTPGGGGGGEAIAVDAVDDKVVFDGPAAEFFFLLGDGEFLVFVAGVAEVGDEEGAGREGVGGHF